jgi:ribulose-phosphate 3-epimerase
MTSKKNYLLSASINCANILELGAQLREIESSGMDYIHFDVMDGRFVPRLGLYPEMLAAIKSATKIPVDVHLMIENPINFIDEFIKAGADMLVVHAESTPHLDRCIRTIKNAGRLAGVAINPATPLSVLDHLLDEIDAVMVMAINPGIVGHKMIPYAMKKISDLKAKLSEHPNIIIMVDGGVTFESASDMIMAGADMLVCGSSTIFRPDETIAKKTEELRNLLDNI